MEKIGFVMSMLLSFLGVLLLSVGLLVQAVLPKLGLMAFMIGGGSYASRAFELGPAYYLHQAVALACIVIGTAASVKIWKARIP